MKATVLKDLQKRKVLSWNERARKWVVDSGKLFTETNEQKFSLRGAQSKKICSHPRRSRASWRWSMLESKWVGRKEMKSWVSSQKHRSLYTPCNISATANVRDFKFWRNLGQFPHLAENGGTRRQIQSQDIKITPYPIVTYPEAVHSPVLGSNGALVKSSGMSFYYY